MFPVNRGIECVVLLEAGRFCDFQVAVAVAFLRFLPSFITTFEFDRNENGGGGIGLRFRPSG